MRLKSEHKRVLNCLLQVAERGQDWAYEIDAVAKQLDVPVEELKPIYDFLRGHELIQPTSNNYSCCITAAGREQLKPWWKRHHLLIVFLATLLFAAIAPVFTILLYFRGCEDKITGT